MRPITCTFQAAALAVLSMTSIAQAGPGFDVVTLGARGGIEDGNLSAFMISPAGDGRAVTCDAGSLVNGLRVADEKGRFRCGRGARRFALYARRLRADRTDQGLSRQPRASRPHRRPGHRFARRCEEADLWPAVSHGACPGQLLQLGRPGRTSAPAATSRRLKKYEMTRLVAGERRDLSGTAMQVTAYPLSHGGRANRRRS